MKQVICRIDEAKLGPLMDQFVGRIQRKVAIEDAIFESSDNGDTKRVGVVAVFRHKGEQLQVLMGKREYDPEEGKYAIPGGHVKEGETTEEGAKREIKEETGLTVDNLKKLLTRPGDAGETVTIYGTLYTGEEKAEADDETGAVRWFNVADLPDGLAWDNNELIPKLAKDMELSEGLEAEETDPLVRRGYRYEGHTVKHYIRSFGEPEIIIYFESHWVDVDVVIYKHHGRMFRTTGDHLLKLLDAVEPIASSPAPREEKYEQLRVLDLPYAQGEDRPEERPLDQWLNQRSDNADEQSFAEALDAKRFIMNTPTFTFKTSYQGHQVFVNTTHAGPWPTPIGVVNLDPEGNWWIVSGKMNRGAWRWYDTDWVAGENGGVQGPRFPTMEQAGLEVWHNYREAKHNQPIVIGGKTIVP